MIYLIFTQYLKYRMLITQQHSVCRLTTNSMKFMQQMTSSLSEADKNVCNCYLLHFVYQISWPKVKPGIQMSIFSTKITSQTFAPFTGSIMNDSLLLSMFAKRLSSMSATIYSFTCKVENIFSSTHLTRHEKYYQLYVQDFLGNLTAKELRKSVNIHRSCDQKSSVSFFETQCIYL